MSDTLLDAIDEDGAILFTWDIPTAKAFRFIYRKLSLRVERATREDAP